MSIHLLECAAHNRLPASTKLALMAFADSADRHTHIAFPGMDQVMTWSGVGRSRAKEIVAELVEAGVLRHHRRGSRGRRAEYVVFPEGCCAEHPRPPADNTDDPAVAALVVVPSAAPSEFTGTPAIGAGGPAPMSVTVAATAAPNPTDLQIGATQAAPVSRIGAGLGPLHRPPYPTTTTNPPNPPPPAGGACPRHDTPTPNCRRCGTTPRQQATNASREAADRRRLAAQAANRAKSATARASAADPDTIRAAAQTVRAHLRSSS